MATTTVKSGTETYSSAIEDARNYTRWIISRFEKYIGSHLLEVGLGHGGYRRLLPALSSYTGVDIDANAVRTAQQSNQDGDYFILDIADASGYEQLRGSTIDTVLCVNVLEHVLEHQSAVDNLLSIIASGGHLLVFVPAHQFLYGKLDELAGHHRRYNKSSLSRLVPAHCAKIVSMEYFNAVGVPAWWLNGRLQYSSLDDDTINRQINIFDKYVVPISRAVDVVTRPYVGQSLISIIEKK